MKSPTFAFERKNKCHMGKRPRLEKGKDGIGSKIKRHSCRFVERAGFARPSEKLQQNREVLASNIHYRIEMPYWRLCEEFVSKLIEQIRLGPWEFDG
jgi:hypothetical protein